MGRAISYDEALQLSPSETLHNSAGSFRGTPKACARNPWIRGHQGLLSLCSWIPDRRFAASGMTSPLSKDFLRRGTLTPNAIARRLQPRRAVTAKDAGTFPSAKDRTYVVTADRPVDRARRAHRDRDDRRRLCDVHVGGDRAQAPAGGDLEQRVVPALLVRGDQLHAELGLRRVCRRRLLARRLHHHDVPAPHPAAARAGAAVRQVRWVERSENPPRGAE